MSFPKISFVSDWRNAYRWFSVHAMLWASVAQVTYMGLPNELKASLPQKWVTCFTTAILILGIVGRLVNQGEDNGTSNQG